MLVPKASSLKERVLRRRVIIRKYDYDRMVKDALGVFEGTTLYDRAEFTPLNRDALEKQSLLLMLRDNPRWQHYKPTPYPIHLLARFSDYLYDQSYLKWTVQWDDRGSMWIQSRSNTPRTELGWAVFEKDL